VGDYQQNRKRVGGPPRGEGVCPEINKQSSSKACQRHPWLREAISSRQNQTEASRPCPSAKKEFRHGRINTMLAAASQEQQLSSRPPTLVAPIDTIVQ